MPNRISRRTCCAILWLSVFSVAALPQTRDLRYEKRDDPAPRTSTPAKVWALVVGISTYKNLPPQAQLQFAHRDAEEFARFLRSEAAGSVPASQIRVLTNGNATVSAIRAALHTWLPRVVGRGDVVYIFIAGHGVVAEQNEGYFVASDSDPQNLHATGVSFREVNETLSSKLKAEAIILLADACHAGTIGWTPESAIRGDAQPAIESLGARDQSILKLLASRPSERSFEDERWDGGHGVFTYALLSGLRGAAERDRDGTIRVSQLIAYVSQVVPQQTERRQNPRVAGNFEPRLLLARGAPGQKPDKLPTIVSFDVTGPPGASVYFDRAYRGAIRTNADLRLEAVPAGAHRLEVELPGGDSFEQTIAIAAGQPRIDLNSLPGFAVARLQAAIRQGKVLQPGGAWDYYKSQQFTGDQKILADSLIASALEDIGQACVNDYVQSNTVGLKARMFADASEAYRRLRDFRPDDQSIEAKRSFCQGRAQIATGHFEEAVASLHASLQIDSDFACAYNALGVALVRLKRNPEARAAFEHAVQLTPEWFLPPLQLAQEYLDARQPAQALPLLEKSVRYNPRAPLPHWLLLRTLRTLNMDRSFAKRANEMIEKFPNYAPAYLEIAEFYEGRRDFPHAAQFYDAYVTLAPNFQDSASVRARADRARSLAVRKVPTLQRDEAPQRNNR